MNLFRISLLSSTAAALCGFSVKAIDITITDQYSGQSQFDSSSAAGNAATKIEDGSTEPGTISNQTWDLEAFYGKAINATQGSLGVIGGFDMKSGAASGPDYTPIGDIFIRIGAPVDAHTIGSGSDPVAFDYVIHFPATPNVEPFTGADYWTAGANSVAYSVYSAADVNVIPTGNDGITPGAALATGWLWQASPKSGASSLYSGTADYADNQSDNATGILTGVTGLKGGNHDVLSNILIDLSLLGSPTSLYFYTTMGCGNDLLEGGASATTTFTVPDGGATVAMLGAGLTGLALIRRRMA